MLKYGLIPEMIGRLPVLGALSELDEDGLYSILTQPKNALTKQYKKLMDMENVDLEFEEDALHAVVENALKRKTGARSLRSIMENVMLDIMYRVPSMPALKSITITRDVVINKSEPVYQFAKSKKRA